MKNCATTVCASSFESNRKTFCDFCLSVRASYSTEQNNIRINAQKAAAKPIRFCGCGCGVEVAYPFKYTNACRDAATLRIKTAKSQRLAAERLKQKVGDIIPKPKAKTMTAKERDRLDETQRNFDREVNSRLCKDHGYGHGPIIVYSGADAERVPVTPIHLIPKRESNFRGLVDAF